MAGGSLSSSDGEAGASSSSHRSSPLATFQNLVKPFIGAGILALPFAFKSGGLLASVLLMALLALMANYCIRCLLHCLRDITQPGYKTPAEQSAASPPLLSPLLDSGSSSLRHPSLASATRRYSPTAPPSFRDIGYAAFGSVGKYAVDVSLVASQLGFCTAYVAFIGENMNTVVPSVSGTVWMLLMTGCLLLLCQLRHVSSVAFTSAIGNGIYLVSVVIILVDGIRHACCLSGRDERSGESLALVRLSGLPFVFGTACFALEGIGLILPVKAAMRHVDQHRFSCLLNSAVLLVACSYLLFGSLGYVFYGEAVSATITANLSGGAVSDAVRVSLCISLFFSYILQMFPVVDISDYAVYCVMSSREATEQQDSAGRLMAEQPEDADGKEEAELSGAAGVVNGAQAGQGSADVASRFPFELRSPALPGVLPPSSAFASPRTPRLTLRMVAVQCCLRCLWVALTAVVAIAVSNFGFVVSLTGSLANSLIAFILPAAFFIRLVVLERHRGEAGCTAGLLLDLALPALVVVSAVAASCIGVYLAVDAEVHRVSSSA
jgi:proton-coupled amino acid transporter